MLRRVANGFDVVAVRIDHEGRVVVGVVLRAQARRPVVLRSGFHLGPVERIDLRPARGLERDVARGRLLLRLEKDEGNGVVGPAKLGRRS